MVLALTVSLVETRPEHGEAVVHLAVITAVSRRPATLSEFPDAFRDDAADTRPWTALHEDASWRGSRRVADLRTPFQAGRTRITHTMPSGRGPAQIAGWSGGGFP